ncbi:MAG TPA: nucleotidyl transferase AbiEii/AbiGii toxin family protein [Aggregatilineales bacterium]|nr:nucleotidyl transferase AbiEii/AbiGii toxin family protein [Aggregatilineales bacterium]
MFHKPDLVWLLKGGYAVELRLDRQARTTLDIDLASADTDRLRLVAAAEPEEQTLDVALDHLQELASLDLGDYFSFVIAKSRELATAPEGGLRCTVECRVGGRRFTNFRLDFGLGDPVVSEPEWVASRNLLAFAGHEPVRIPLLPTEQQIAEKFHAYTLPWHDRANTRSKDLIDLMLLFETQTLDQHLLKEALRATFSHRNTHPLPEHLPPPPDDWSSEFAEMAIRFRLSVSTLAEAYSYLQDIWERWELGVA